MKVLNKFKLFISLFSYTYILLNLQEEVLLLNYILVVKQNTSVMTPIRYLEDHLNISNVYHRLNGTPKILSPQANSIPSAFCYLSVQFHTVLLLIIANALFR